jgi:hypothetical protein
MSDVRLRAVREEDLEVLAAKETREFDPWNNFEIGASNRFRRRFAENGGIGEEPGMLAVETARDASSGRSAGSPSSTVRPRRAGP